MTINSRWTSAIVPGTQTESDTESEFLSHFDMVGYMERETEAQYQKGFAVIKGWQKSRIDGEYADLLGGTLPSGPAKHHQ